MTTQDIIGLIALLLGLQVSVMGLVAGFVVPTYLRRTRSIREDLKKIGENTERHKIMVHILAEALLELSAVDQAHGGLIQRLVFKTGTGQDVPKMAEVLLARDRALVKRIQELMLLHPRGERRRSAMLQLSQDLGDLQTLDLFRRVVARSGEDGKELRKAMKRLELRLGAESIGL